MSTTLEIGAKEKIIYVQVCFSDSVTNAVIQMINKFKSEFDKITVICITPPYNVKFMNTDDYYSHNMFEKLVTEFQSLITSEKLSVYPVNQEGRPYHLTKTIYDHAKNLLPNDIDYEPQIIYDKHKPKHAAKLFSSNQDDTDKYVSFYLEETNNKFKEFIINYIGYQNDGKPPKEDPPSNLEKYANEQLILSNLVLKGSLLNFINLKNNTLLDFSKQNPKSKECIYFFIEHIYKINNSNIQLDKSNFINSKQYYDQTLNDFVIHINTHNNDIIYKDDSLLHLDNQYVYLMSMNYEYGLECVLNQPDTENKYQRFQSLPFAWNSYNMTVSDFISSFYALSIIAEVEGIDEPIKNNTLNDGIQTIKNTNYLQPSELKWNEYNQIKKNSINKSIEIIADIEVDDLFGITCIINKIKNPQLNVTIHIIVDHFDKEKKLATRAKSKYEKFNVKEVTTDIIAIVNTQEIYQHFKGQKNWDDFADMANKIDKLKKGIVSKDTESTKTNLLIHDGKIETIETKNRDIIEISNTNKKTTQVFDNEKYTIYLSLEKNNILGAMIKPKTGIHPAETPSGIHPDDPMERKRRDYHRGLRTERLGGKKKLTKKKKTNKKEKTNKKKKTYKKNKTYKKKKTNKKKKIS